MLAPMLTSRQCSQVHTLASVASDVGNGLSVGMRQRIWARYWAFVSGETLVVGHACQGATWALRSLSWSN
jgi:hypothetical protein